MSEYQQRTDTVTQAEQPIHTGRVRGKKFGRKEVS